MKMSFKFRKSSLAGWIFLPVLLLFCTIYYFIFSHNLSIYDGENGLFQLGLNSHDHYIYRLNIDLIRNGDGLFELANDKGIAWIYLKLSELFPILVNEEFTLLSFIFNCVTLFFCYLIYSSICNRFDLGFIGKLSFFANLSLIYFSQLINKDLLTIFAFLLTINFGIRGRIYPLLLMLPFFLFVRLQLGIFILIFAYLLPNSRTWPKIIFIYILTSLTAGLLSVFASIIGEDSLGDGFNAFLIGFNQEYYIGYLLFNPLRIFQYIIDALSSFIFMTESGGVDTAKLLRLPQLILLIFLFKPLSSFITRFNYWLQTPARPLVLAVISYLLTWLMNPTINARYVMLITPVLVLFALYVRRQNKRGSIF